MEGFPVVSLQALPLVSWYVESELQEEEQARRQAGARSPWPLETGLPAYFRKMTVRVKSDTEQAPE